MTQKWRLYHRWLTRLEDNLTAEVQRADTERGMKCLRLAAIFQRLTHWKDLRALGLPGFLRSTTLLSRVR